MTWSHALLEVNVMDEIRELLKAVLFVALLIWLVYGLLKWQALIHRKKQRREAWIPTGMLKPVSQELAPDQWAARGRPAADKRREISLPDVL